MCMDLVTEVTDIYDQEVLDMKENGIESGGVHDHTVAKSLYLRSENILECGQGSPCLKT